MRTFLFLPLLALVACSGDDAAKDDTGGGDNGADNGGDDCGVTIKSTMPADGSTNGYYRGNIEFELSAADATAAITTDIAGTQSTSSDGKFIIWTPSAPLTPETSYSASLTYCGGTADITFTTSAVGTPVDASILPGLTYALDLASANIVEPPGIGAVLSSYLTTAVLIGVPADETVGSSVQMIGALAVKNSTRQDYCDPSIAFPEADFGENPYFAIGPQDTQFNVAGYQVDIQDLNITGAFAPNASAIEGATLSGTIDTRPLSGLVDPKNEAAICELAANFQAECEPCPSDGQPFCLTLVANQILGEQVDGSLVVVEGNDCEGCESGPPAEDAVCATE